MTGFLSGDFSDGDEGFGVPLVIVLLSGQNYANLQPAISICLLNQILFVAVSDGGHIPPRPGSLSDCLVTARYSGGVLLRKSRYSLTILASATTERRRVTRPQQLLKFPDINSLNI